jgi:thioredoxin 1
MSAIAHVTDQTFDAVIQQQGAGLTIVDFWAPWCAPCRAIAPVLERIASERTDVRIVKVDSDENLALMGRYGIRGIPTLLFFREGALVEQVVGAVGKDRLDQRIDELLATPASPGADPG